MKEFDYYTQRNKMYLDRITKMTKEAQERGVLKGERIPVDDEQQEVIEIKEQEVKHVKTKKNK